MQKHSTAAFELTLARDQFGRPLDDQTRGRIQLYLCSELPHLWPEIANIVVSNDPALPLWQAVEIVAPGHSGRQLIYDELGAQTVTWVVSPRPQVVRDALGFATH